MSDVVIRAASAADLRFLEDMLVEAANAPDRKGRGRVETLADPAVACYVESWPRATDLGVVAVEEPDRPIGAAWLRLFDDAERAYGFVRPDIPELAIGVVADQRGRGVGRALLRACASEARDRGFEHISLSVGRTNPAAALYRTEGYQVVKSRENADTMVLGLLAPRHTAAPRTGRPDVVSRLE